MTSEREIQDENSDFMMSHFTIELQLLPLIKSSLLRYLLAIVPDHHTISVKYEVPGRESIGRRIRKI